MATMEEFGVLMGCYNESYRLLRQMRDNADQYLVEAAGTRLHPVTLGEGMKADATEFLRRIKRLDDIVARNQTLVTNALGIIGVTLASAVTLRNTLVGSCNHTLAATLTTAPQCTAEANAILATVPNWDGLF